MEVTSQNGVTRQITVTNHSKLIYEAQPNRHYKSRYCKLNAVSEIAHTGCVALPLLN